MLCPNCKKEIPDGSAFCSSCGANFGAPAQPVNYAQPVYNAQPVYAAPPAPAKKPVTKKWWFWVIIVVAVIAVIGIFSGGDDTDSGSSDNITTSQSADADSNDIADTNDTADTTTKAPATTKAPETTKSDDNRYYVGDTIDANNLKIKFTSADVWYGYNQYLGPEAGNKIVRIKIDVTNDKTTDAYISMFEFTCYADNQVAGEYIYGDESFSTVTLSSGRSASGYIYFEVPEDAESIEVEYETNYWTGNKAILVVEL